MKTQTPKGVRDLLPDDVEARGDVTSALRNLFKENGFKRIITPTYELYDVLKRGMGPKLQKMAIKFFDNYGQAMVLRPDMTTPIARVAANRMQDESAIKLFYTANVFRQQLVGAGKDSEFYQAGIEMIGQSGVKADAQIIALVVQGMRRLGIEDFMVDIGHMDLIKKMDPEKRKALEEQDYVKFGEIPLRGTDEVFESFPYFKELYEELKLLGVEKNVMFNLGLVKEFGYYTGVVFECYVGGVGYLVGSGGRYDDLVGAYGDDKPAIGFAFGIERLLLALDRRNKD